MATDIDTSMKEMKSEINYQKLFLEIMYTVGGWLITVILLNSIGIIWLSDDEDVMTSFLVITAIQFPVHVNSFRDFTYRTYVR